MEKPGTNLKDRIWRLRSIFPFLGIILLLLFFAFVLRDNIVYVVFFLFGAIIFGFITFRHIKATSNDAVTTIFYSLQKMGVVDKTREIKPSNKVFAFKADLIFFNTIFYDPRCCSLDENTIRFVLLHEEGHIVKKQYVKPPLVIFLILILTPLLLLTINSFTNRTDFLGSVVIPVTIVSNSVLFLFFMIKILTDPLRQDEFQSDEFAAKILYDQFKIIKPSIVVDTAFKEIRKIYEEEFNKNIKDSFIFRLIFAIANYHPSDADRVTNIREKFDS